MLCMGKVFSDIIVINVTKLKNSKDFFVLFVVDLRNKVLLAVTESVDFEEE